MKKITSVNRLIIGLLFCSILLSSCTKNLENLSRGDDLSETPQRQEAVSLMKEIETILETAYLNPNALDEVNAAIYSGFEGDESITFKHLLAVKSSPLYHFDKFISKPIRPGSFRAEFDKLYTASRFPTIKKYYGSILEESNTNYALNNVTTNGQASSAVLDSSNETFLVNNTKIYFPYSQNWGSTFNPGSTGINTMPNPKLVSLCYAKVDTDSEVGKEPNVFPASGSTPASIRFKVVTINDNYAELVRPTHIVGIYDGLMDPPPPPVPPLNVRIYKAYVGWVKCKTQYDRLISITGNGGGSELRFLRGYAVLDGTGHVNANSSQVPANLSRKQIRKQTWVHVLLLWDTNWSTDRISQELGIYEQDTKDNIVLSATVGNTVNGTTVGTTVSTTASSQDAIIRNLVLDRNFYFADGTHDQGFGFQDAWPIFDGTTTVAYTLPYQIVN